MTVAVRPSPRIASSPKKSPSRIFAMTVTVAAPFAENEELVTDAPPGEGDAGADFLELEPRRDRRAPPVERVEERDAGEVVWSRRHRG